MNKEIKIEDLRINQTVWLNGEEKTIDFLYLEDNGCGEVGFDGSRGMHSVDKINLSLTPPQKTERFYNIQGDNAGPVAWVDILDNKVVSASWLED